MSFTFTPAVRDRVGLLISLSGGTGSGKSLSSMKLARGLAGGDDSKIAFLDTEGGRGKMYAPAPGEKPGANSFGFMHGDMHAPFSPEAYTEAIEVADKAGFEVIVIDSFSHEWAGDGGVTDMQEELLAELVDKARASHEKERRSYDFDEDKTRERLGMVAWKGPKGRHKRLVSRLLQCRAHLIVCLRAEEKLRMETVEEEGSGGRKFKKTIITQPKDLPIDERWVPICEKRFPFELTLSLLLTRDRPGFPIPLKLQEQHKASVPLDKPLNEETGRQLAEWARGGAPTPPVAKTATTDAHVLLDHAALLDIGTSKSREGQDALKLWWDGLQKEQRLVLKADISQLKQLAAAPASTP